jgi:hypothetical protein
MTDLRVPTTRQPVTITCADGRAYDGHIFMPSQSSRHPGPMRPDEWGDTVHAFFPFQALEATCSTVFNLEAVVALTIPAPGATAEADGHDADLAVAAPVAHVSVDAGGATFAGQVIIDMPPNRQRVADWLNAPGAFVTVRAGGRHHLVHKRHITRVVEMSERNH